MGSRIQLIEQSLMDRLVAQAASTARLRTNYNFHQDLAENPNRFLNVMLKDTYVRPHCHMDPPKSESFVLLSGEVAFFIFDAAGKVLSRHDLSGEPAAPCRGIDIGPGIWHSLVVLTESSVCFEVKPGPYAERNDKEFAAWAPAEGSTDCQAYLQKLLSGRRMLQSGPSGS